MQAEHESASVSGPAKTQDDLEVFFIDLEAVEALLGAEEMQTPRLSAADEQRAAGIADVRAGRLWRTARIATRLILERVAGITVRRLPFQIETGGRPALGGGAPHFSISHTASAALVAVAKSIPIGVDLEAAGRRVKMSDDRRKRIVRAAARFGPEPNSSAIQDGDVLAAWVRLEAVAKARGTGMGRLLTEAGVVGGAEPTNFKTTDPDVEVRCLSAGPLYVAAIAARRLPAELKVQSFPTMDLEAFLNGRRDQTAD